MNPPKGCGSGQDTSGVVGRLQALLSCASVTPADDGVMAVVAAEAEAAGFHVDLIDSVVGPHRAKNLVGQMGQGAPVLAFAGHVDVVPAGDPEAWTHPPFAGRLQDGMVYGRGAVDMKGALAAFLGAAGQLRRQLAAGRSAGTLMLYITGDEEAGSPAGMRALLAHVAGRAPVPEACLIGEPSCEGFLGQGTRIGRRGSLNLRVVAHGVAGHVAWPDRAVNALHLVLDFCQAARRLDLGGPTESFPATTLSITSVDSDSQVGNVIPGTATARLNIRFNPQLTGTELQARLNHLAAGISPRLKLHPHISGEPYAFANVPFAATVGDAAEAVTGHRPQQNCGGGVSDGRFLRQLCPVVEFGLVGDLAHHLDERVSVEHLCQLEQIYWRALCAFYSLPGDDPQLCARP